MVRSDCIHEVPHGAHVDPLRGDVTLGGKLVAHYADCPEAPRTIGGSRQGPAPMAGGAPVPAADSGYVEQVLNLSTSNFVQLQGYLIVPSTPTVAASEGAGTTFLWNGIESDNEDALLQPVLQYGTSDLNPGGYDENYWMLGVWAVFQNNTFKVTGACANDDAFCYGGPPPVNVGDYVYLLTQALPGSGAILDWSIIIEDIDNGVNWALDVDLEGYQWGRAYGAVLETADQFGVGCAGFPANGSATFLGSTLSTGTSIYAATEVNGGWTSQDCFNNTICGTYSYGYVNCNFGPPTINPNGLTSNFTLSWTP